jgi:Lrp/AsnC family leucine-responsive transcriptional regulator
MDKTNYRILEILQEKARIPNVEVSRRINLAPSAVLERIRKMEQQGVIAGYELRLNPDHFDCGQIVFVIVQIRGVADLDPVGESLARLEQVQEVHFIAGVDGYLVKLRCRNTADLNALLTERIGTIDGVTATKTHPVLSTWKETAQIPLRRT